MNRRILCVDFDGVLHSYESGWKGPAVIKDPPVPGAIHFLTTAVQYFDVQIYSTRSADEFGLIAMKMTIRRWDIEEQLRSGVNQAVAEAHADDLLKALSFPTEKPAAFVTIDDRAIQFRGLFPSMLEIMAFKPWNKE